MTDTEPYQEIFGYLSEASDLPVEAEPCVVFCRADELLADAATDLVVAGLVNALALTGGVGKDTKDLLRQGYRSEAHFVERHIEDEARWRTGIVLPPILLDERANNGQLNARNAIRLLVREGHNLNFVTAVAHATSLRRLAATLEFAVEQKNVLKPIVHKKPTAYEFDASDPADQQEAALELLRLADWPKLGVLNPQPDLPEDLIRFARSKYEKAPDPPSFLKFYALSMLPRRLQIRFFERLSRQSTAK